MKLDDKQNVESERSKLMELLEAQHDPAQVQRRMRQIKEFLESSMKHERSGIVALALSEILDYTLLGILKGAQGIQNATGAKRIILAD